VPVICRVSKSSASNLKLSEPVGSIKPAFFGSLNLRRTVLPISALESCSLIETIFFGFFLNISKNLFIAVEDIAAITILVMCMNILEAFIQTEIKRLLNEGQLEKSVPSLEQVVSMFKNKTFIFFDTETTTLDPKKDFAMITEIAGVAYDTNTGERLGEYNAKARLTAPVFARIKKEKEEKEAGTWSPNEKTVEDLFQMTNYYEQSAPYIEEEKLLTEFVEFVNDFADRSPILVAHNAKFDMYHIGKGLTRHKLPRMYRYPVLDTRALTTNYLFPLLSALEASTEPEAMKLLTILRPAKRFVNRLGNLGDAFEVSTKHWHSALADTEQLSGILAAIITFMDKHQHVELAAPKKKR